MSKNIRDLLDAVAQSKGFGKTSASTLNVMRGINHRGAGNLAPANVDSQGLTFFTKPNMNLSYDNVKSIRRLSFLADGGSRSLGNAIRCSLSPSVNGVSIGSWNQSSTTDNSATNIRSEIVEDTYAFIPMLTNLIESISGWPDMVVDSNLSAEGIRKEVTGHVDSHPDYFGAFDLTANFQNVDGDPITALFAVWLEYMQRVAVGDLNPHPNSIIEKEIDYNTRIYRLVLDPTKTFVRKIADCGAAYPTANPIGAAFNYSAENFFTQDTGQLSIQFQCFGARYNDPITIYNFNKVVRQFNKDMHDDTRETRMVKLNSSEKPIFNYQGYPRISETLELEWWVYKDRYDALLADYGNSTEKTPSDDAINDAKPYLPREDQ